jgi:YD repeat-containing protein
MKKKLLFTTVMLGISLSAACMTAKEQINPYHPAHIYGDLKVDSVVEMSSSWSQTITFDEKGRMAAMKSYDIDQQTHQFKYEGGYEFGYGDGFMYTSLHVHFNEDGGWIEFDYKFDDIVYDAFGNPISWTRFVWNQETSAWEPAEYSVIQYDLLGNIVYERDSTIEGGETYVHETTCQYTYDNEGRVLSDIRSDNNKREYTYNSNGDVLTVTEYYGYFSETYDENLGEYVRDSAATWEKVSFKQYIYNSSSNLDKIIEYRDTPFAVTTYFYSPLEAIENLRSDSDKPVKLFHNGQVLILRGDKTYTLTGQEVK